MKHRYSIRTLFLLGLVVTFLSCGEKEEAQPQAVRPVKFMEIGYVGNSKERVFSGTAKSEKIINMSFRSQGVLVELNAKLGQTVKKGDLLGKLDNVEARLNLEKAITSQTSAESQMNTAKLALDRIRVLYEKGSASLTDFESAKNSYKTAQQSYESAKRGVSIQREQVQYGFMNAPEAGVITSVQAEVDENISPGQTVAVLNAGTDMEINLGLPESVVNEVHVKMPVQVSFSALPDKTYKGVISELSPAVDVNNSTYPALVKLLEGNDEIKSGMAANVTFQLSEESKATSSIRIPAQAVGEDSNGRFVFIIEEANDKATVKKNPVTIGDLNSEGFEIVQGLQPGQKIAVAGLQTLLDGQEVSLQ